MKECISCNNVVNDNERFCTNCGSQTFKDVKQDFSSLTIDSNAKLDSNVKYYSYVDTGSIWWFFVGFFIPVCGYTLYFVWKDMKPKSGKKALIGAIISSVLKVVMMVLAFLIIIAFYIALLPKGDGVLSM